MLKGCCADRPTENQRQNASTINRLVTDLNGMDMRLGTWRCCEGYRSKAASAPGFDLLRSSGV